MKIKTQVSISLIIFAILAFVIIFSAYTSYNQLQDIQKKQQIIDSIEQSSFDLYYLETDYFIHGGTIPFELWNAKYAALTGQLQALTLTVPSQKAVLNQMSDSKNELNKSFSDLVAVTSGGQGTGSGGVSQELKEFSASTLEVQAQMLMSQSSELSQLVKAETLELRERTILVTLFSIALLMLFILLNYLVINRSILKSISALQKGAERIGSGDLDTIIETISNDELGYLSHEFNEMTSGLKNSQTLLLTSNIELERKNHELEAAYEQLAAADEELKAQFDALAESERITRINEERLLMAQEIGHNASWEYDLVTNKVWGSAEGPRIYGFTPVDGEFSIEDLEACIPDRERVHQALVDLISEGKEFNLECSVIPRDGTATKMIHSVARLEKDAQGNPLKVMGIIQDITGRKVAENALMRVNQKLNVLSQLTRQDLNTQIFILNSYLEMAKKQATGQDKIIKYIEDGERAVRSIRDITEFTKDYQSMGEKLPKWQNIKLAFLFGLSHISIGEIQHSLEIENLEIFADPLLEKAFQGLLENSVAHGGHVSEIRLSHTMTPDGVTIVYEDDGIGISSEKKDRIFLRGDNLRASVRGLFFVREILDITGISLSETGEPGKGARFEMTVPKGSYRLKPEKGTGQDSRP